MAENPDVINQQNVISREPLTKPELKKLFWGYQLLYSFSINFKNWHGNGYAYNMIPLYKKYYNKQGQVDGMNRQLDFHNNEHTTASIIWGIMVGMEEQMALGKEVTGDMIRTTKSALMGPVAGVGDSLVQATIVPLLTTIAISLTGLGDNLSPLGCILYLLATPIVLWSYAWILYNQGYKVGRNAVTLLSGEIMQKARTAISVFGVIVIGALSASYVGVKTPLQFTASAEADPIVLQNIFDGIFPNVLSLLLVLFCYFLVSKKNVSIAKLIFGLMAAVIALTYLGIM